MQTSFSRTLPLFLALFAPGHFLFPADDISSGVIELEAFVVYEGLIDVIDGFTGEPYHESNRVVDSFREEFNNILLAYHKRLLQNELKALTEHVERDKAFVSALSELAETFGVSGFSIDEKEILTRDKSMLARLARDPFFKIEQLVVWDLDQLARYSGGKPRSKYAEDIRYNENLERWERRVTTEWKVNYSTPQRGGGYREVNVTKYQGLNLETNRGYHFCPPGVPANVPPYAFRDVILNYPIFINSKEPYQQQVERLQNEFVINLSHIYDPFSWAFRSNIRYRGTFFKQLLERVQSNRLPISDREWFDVVFTRLLCDVTTIKRHGAWETYDFEMLLKVPVNKNRLGDGLDLLNWNPGENREVSYNPTQQWPVQIDFDSARHARFILVDAYRRYEERFMTALRERLASVEGKVSGKELIKEVLADVSGVSADAYIRAATKAQKAELEKYRHQLD
jgi:hypothetical protein